jgi:putative zinc finger/helix-turn-helix YgiT family protein
MKDSDRVVYYCPQCDLDVETRVENKKEVYSVRGEDILTDCAVRICNVCNTPLFDENLDEGTLKKVYDLYREKHNIFSSEEICEVREKYGLSQRGMASLLNWSPTTIARYETGALPDSAHMATLLMVRDNKEFARQLYERTKDKMGRLDRNRLEAALAGAAPSKSVDLGYVLSKRYKDLDSLYLGYAEFTLEKISNLILYFSQAHPRLSKTKLMKLLFYTDFNHFKNHGYSLSGMPYQHLPYGPVPYNHGLLLDYLVENDIVSLVPFESFDGEYFVPRFEPDLSGFDEEELATIRKVAEHFRPFNAKEISDLSHEEEAYVATGDRELISYKFAESLRDF